MEFVIFRCSSDPEVFIVTDEEHSGQLPTDLCPGGQLERVGEFAEMGKDRIAFNEAIAKSAIRDHGCYKFAAKSFSTSEWPATMP